MARCEMIRSQRDGRMYWGVSLSRPILEIDPRGKVQIRALRVNLPGLTRTDRWRLAYMRAR
jgi:hypothetical protein